MIWLPARSDFIRRDGKRFYWFGQKRDKPHADQFAGYYRRMGYRVRIVKRKLRFGPGHIYDIYARG